VDVSDEICIKWNHLQSKTQRRRFWLKRERKTACKEGKMRKNEKKTNNIFVSR
jgi:hypothetical protein